MHRFAVSMALGGALALASIGGVAAGDKDGLAKTLKDRGYHHIQIVKTDASGGEANACKGNTHFFVSADASGNIVDVDPIGDCTTDKGPAKLRVQAPYADVEVGGGVRVRAPGVDINIP